MKPLKYFLILFVLSIATYGYSTNPGLDTDPPNEFITLAEFLKDRAEFLRGEFPIIDAEEVKNNLRSDTYHVIDIRTDSWFEYGHIKNAANVKADELLNYFNSSINPEDFEKIVLVCYSGQSAAYYTGLLRLAGYENVYSMKWGMSSWREDFADPWLKNTKGSLEDELELTQNTLPTAGDHPELTTGKTEAPEILENRLQHLFAIPYKDYILDHATVFETPANFYTVYQGEAVNYEKGHIPGSVLYENNTLTLDAHLLTLPKDKKVALYTTTGQEAAYILAYLNVLGYDAGNIAYGENAFRNKALNKEGRDAFNSREINLFPVIE